MRNSQLSKGFWTELPAQAGNSFHRVSAACSCPVMPLLSPNFFPVPFPVTAPARARRNRDRGATARATRIADFKPAKWRRRAARAKLPSNKVRPVPFALALN